VKLISLTLVRADREAEVSAQPKPSNKPKTKNAYRRQQKKLKKLQVS
jgi:hypothetical protein